jgi:LacI family transcriptional regulator
MPDEPAIRRVAFAGREVSEFFYEGIRGIMDYAEQSGRWQLIGWRSEPMVPFDRIDLSVVDGVIGFFHERQWADVVTAAGVPAVNLSNLHEDLDLPRVASDDHAVGRAGAEHLLQRGYVHYGFVGPFSAWFARQRHAGFTSVIEEQAGRVCHVLDIQADRSNRREVIARWLGPLPKPLGVMAATDQEGRLLIEITEAMDLGVPDDVAVLGVDNRRWLTQMAGVGMSSVELDQRQIGYRAAKLLDGLMDGEAPTPPQWIAPRGVVTRRSTESVVADDPIVTRAIAYIREHSAGDVSVEDLLDELGISRRTLEMHLKRATGLTPRMAIVRAKIDRAKQLLAQSDEPIYRVAAMCGFDRPRRFFRVFKQQTGLTPGAYRRRFGNAAEPGDRTPTRSR